MAAVVVVEFCKLAQTRVLTWAIKYVYAAGVCVCVCVDLRLPLAGVKQMNRRSNWLSTLIIFFALLPVCSSPSLGSRSYMSTVVDIAKSAKSLQPHLVWSALDCRMKWNEIGWNERGGRAGGALCMCLHLWVCVSGICRSQNGKWISIKSVKFSQLHTIPLKVSFTASLRKM